MTGQFTLNRVEEIVTRSHSDGVTDLAAAALIEHDAKFLLVCAAPRDLDTPAIWSLPAGPVLPGETVSDGLHRILAQFFGYSDSDITGFLGITDADPGPRTFVFAVTVGQPDSVCRDSRIPHHWIGSIAISDLLPDLDAILRTYYASDPG